MKASGKFDFTVASNIEDSCVLLKLFSLSERLDSADESLWGIQK